MWNEPCVGYGNKVKELREKAEISLQELALLTETNRKFIENVEMKIHPSDHFIEKLASAFHMNPTEIKKYIWCEEGSECQL